MPTGRVLSRGNTLSYDESIDPRMWGWSISAEYTLPDILNLYDIEHIETVSGDTGDLYLLTGSYAGTVDVELWLNPEKSYRPERYNTTITASDDGVGIVTVTEFQYQEVAPDLWFPKFAESIVTAANLETGVEADVIHTTARFTDLRINERIPAHHFTLEPEPGTTVYDSRTRESFEVPEENN